MVIKKQGKKSGFSYQRRPDDLVKRRQNQGAGNREGFILSEFKTWTAKTGDSRLRIMPPTWEDAEHYGLDVFVHYGIGPDNSSYICVEETKFLAGDGVKCPACQDRLKAQRKEQSEYADSLKPNRRVLVWMIDRDRENDGPQIWPMPWTVDRDLALLANDKRTGEVYAIDDPEEGYDIEFKREGNGLQTKYVGMTVCRKSNPLADDERDQEEWLDYITENPLTECLIIADPDHIAEQLTGGMNVGDRGGQSDRGRERGRGTADDRPIRRRLADEDEEEPPRRGAAARRGTRDEEDEEEAPPRRSVARGRAKDEDEDIEDETPPARRSASRGRSKSEDEEVEEEKPVRRGKASRPTLDDEEGEEEAIRNPGRGRYAKTEPEDDEDEVEEEKPVRRAPSTGKSSGMRERLRSLK